MSALPQKNDALGWRHRLPQRLKEHNKAGAEYHQEVAAEAGAFSEFD